MKYLVDPLARRFLASRFHGIVSDDLLLVRYTGRRSGREYAVPVGYEARDDELRVTCLADHVWWRNLSSGAPVTVRFRGERRPGTAEVTEDDRAVSDYVDGYLDRHGVDAASRLSIVIEGGERPDAEALVAGFDDLVVVRIETDGDAP